MANSIFANATCLVRWALTLLLLLSAPGLEFAVAQGEASQPSNEELEQRNEAFQANLNAKLFKEVSGMVPGGIDAGSALESQFQQAVKLFTQGKLKEASAVFDALAPSDQRIPPAEVAMAAMAFAVGDSASGQRMLESAAVAHAGYPDVYFSFARIALVQGRVTDADALAEKALATVKEGSFTETQLNFFKQRYFETAYRVARARQNNDDAKIAADELTKVAPEAAVTLIANAELAFDDGDIGQTKALLGKLGKVAGNQNPVPAEVTIANWFQQKGKIEEAGDLLNRATGEHPRDARIHLALAKLELSRENFTGALAAIKTYESIESESTASRDIRGKVAFAKGEFAIAENQFAKILAENPQNFDYANLYALALVHSPDEKKQAQARGVVEQIASMRSNNLVAVSSLAYVLMKTGKLEEAKNIISRVVQRPNLNVEVTFIIAKYLAESGQTPQAKSVLEQLVASKGLFLFRSEAKKLLASVEQSSDGLPTPE